jgi:PAT family beta-lactamase induction signal transducer AmpG
VAVSLTRKLSFVALLYVIEGFPMGVYADVWPIFFRRHGVSLAEIGLYSGLSLAWAAKVLWSPLIDRFGERRRWISGPLLGMAASLFIVSQVPSELGPILWSLMGLYCMASATQDIAIDAYTIGLVERGEEGPANSVRVGAYRVGMLTSGSALLFLPRWIGWDGTFAVAGALSLAFSAAVYACPRVPLRAREAGLIAPLRRWLSRPGVWAVTGFVLLYRVGDRALGPMLKPFWVDLGFADEEIAIYATSFGVAATIAGAAIGGLIVARIGIYRALWWLGGVALLSNLSYAAAALAENAKPMVIAASLVESFCGGLASAAFLSFLMRICEKRNAAVEYALLTALYATSGTAIALPSGLLTEAWGYATYFASTALFALPAFFFLPFSRSWLEGD